MDEKRLSALHGKAALSLKASSPAAQARLWPAGVGLVSLLVWPEMRE
jgi:hypothetical protein